MILDPKRDDFFRTRTTIFYDRSAAAQRLASESHLCEPCVARERWLRLHEFTSQQNNSRRSEIPVVLRSARWQCESSLFFVEAIPEGFFDFDKNQDSLSREQLKREPRCRNRLAALAKLICLLQA